MGVAYNVIAIGFFQGGKVIREHVLFDSVAEDHSARGGMFH